ncbi:MAG: xanthine dehydrogenase family protein molybdopterin-binding subunit [Dehalococcoidia bacterium]|nr:xanthine dehydrogenase family protein molybdopterin-binding subunit [Dehalococcoidia bacterium]
MVATPEKPTYKVIGTRPIRPDGMDKVTGRAEYGADVKLENVLYGAVLRSPHAHARIKRIDTSKAEALPGVKAVATNADFPKPDAGSIDLGEGSANPVWLSENMLAGSKVLYHGHAVAAVAATELHIAEDALALIEVEYEVLPHVIDVREAMLPNAPVLLDDLRTNVRAKGADTPKDVPTNIALHMRIEKGDIEAGFAEAEVVIEREFSTSQAHQGYIEPQNGTAFWNRDGQLTIWCSTQGSFAVRAQCSALLGIPESRIKVIPMEIGGGFGGKLTVYLEPVAALLSRKSHRPVKMWMPRADIIRATGPTSATHNRVKIGAKRDGTIVAAEVNLAYAAGAYPGAPVGAGALCALGPYDVANQRIDGFDVVTNTPKTQAYRAPGAPASEYAVEATLDELAEQLQIDPMDLRLKNAAKEGGTNSAGQPWPRIGAEAVMQAIKNHPHYNSELHGEDTGRGVALGFWFNGGMESSSSATVNSDGTVSLILGSIDIGGSRAALAMQLAETLGLTLDDINPHMVDTDSVGWTGVTGGSRTTFAGGWVAYDLGEEIKKRVVERAARMWNVEADQVSYADGTITGPDDDEGKPRSMTFKEIAKQLQRTGGLIAVSATSRRNTQGAAYAGHIVDLKVDRETGKVTILRYTAIQDVGTAIHPAYVEGQMQGGVAQGVGMALNEEYFYDSEGHVLNASLLDYRMPVANDLPMIDTELVEVPNPGHPYGVRGVGEAPIVPPTPAIRNAIYDAIGVRMYSTPMSPRHILEETLPRED